MKKTLIVIRGAPGHGKTTLGRSIAEERGFDFFEPDIKLDEIAASKGEDARMTMFNQFTACSWSHNKIKESLTLGRSVVTTGLYTKITSLHSLVKLASDLDARLEVIDRFKPEHRFKNTRGTSEACVDDLVSKFEPIEFSDGNLMLEKVVYQGID